MPALQSPQNYHVPAIHPPHLSVASYLTSRSDVFQQWQRKTTEVSQLTVGDITRLSRLHDKGAERRRELLSKGPSAFFSTTRIAET